MNIFLVQEQFAHLDYEQALAETLRCIREAAWSGAELVIFPELWLCGFDYANYPKHLSASKHLLEELQHAAREHHVAVSGSVLQPVAEIVDRYYNHMFFIDAFGCYQGGYNKIHLLPLTGERDHFIPGNTPYILQQTTFRLGFAICYDLRFPELFRYYASQGVNLILLCARFPAQRQQDWFHLLKARAIENQCFIAAVNATGQEGIAHQQLTYLGGSMILGPDGSIKTNQFSARAAQQQIQLTDIAQRKATIDYMKDARLVTSYAWHNHHNASRVIS